jgi:hypothetical protein
MAGIFIIVKVFVIVIRKTLACKASRCHCPATQTSAYEPSRWYQNPQFTADPGAVLPLRYSSVSSFSDRFPLNFFEQLQNKHIHSEKLNWFKVFYENEIAFQHINRHLILQPVTCDFSFIKNDRKPQNK